MFKKIRSNRDPRDTLFSEFRKEFNPFFTKVNRCLRRFSNEYSWQLYSCMLVILGLSLVVSFTMSPEKKAIDQPVVTSKQGISATAGFGQIYKVGNALKQTIKLKAEIESIISQDALSSKDSIRLKTAFDHLQQINQSLENEKH